MSASAEIEDQCAERALVWKQALELNIEYRRLGAFPDSYLAGCERLRFTSTLPSEDDLCAAIQPSGWRTETISGFISTRRYAELLSSGVFPIANVMRAIGSIELAPGPDFIHDVLGHLPYLFCEEYTDYLRTLASAICRQPENSFELQLYEAELALCEERGVLSAVERQRMEIRRDAIRIAAHSSEALFWKLNRLFLWSIEFGVLRAPGCRSSGLALGAGIVSAPSECRALIERTVAVEALSKDCLVRDINFSGPQAGLFAVRSISEYRSFLKELVGVG